MALRPKFHAAVHATRDNLSAFGSYVAAESKEAVRQYFRPITWTYEKAAQLLKPKQ